MRTAPVLLLLSLLLLLLLLLFQFFLKGPGVVRPPFSDLEGPRGREEHKELRLSEHLVGARRRPRRRPCPEAPAQVTAGTATMMTAHRPRPVEGGAPPSEPTDGPALRPPP